MTSVPKPSISGTPRTSFAKNGAYAASPSTRHPTDQLADNKKKEVDDKEVLVDPNNPDKKLRISTDLEAK
jgi:hypothetical protein